MDAALPVSAGVRGSLPGLRSAAVCLVIVARQDRGVFSLLSRLVAFFMRSAARFGLCPPASPVLAAGSFVFCLFDFVFGFGSLDLLALLAVNRL